MGFFNGSIVGMVCDIIFLVERLLISLVNKGIEIMGMFTIRK